MSYKINLKAMMLVASITTLCVLAGASYAQAPSLTSPLGMFLSKYISPGTVANSTFTNTTLNAQTYILMDVNNTPNGYIIVNITSKTPTYSFITNSSSAYAILQPFLVNLYYPNASTLSYLNSSISSYKNTAAPNLNDCLVETGMNNYLCKAGDNYTCIQNACQTAPICFENFQAAPVPQAFINALINYSIQYQQLNLSYGQYFSTLQNMNQDNVGSSLQNLNDYVTSIANISNIMPQGSIFPPNVNLSDEEMSNICTPYLDAGSSDGPWYCYDQDICYSPGFNYTQLSGVQSTLTSLLANPITPQGIQLVADNASTDALFYYEPIYASQQQAIFNAFINSTSITYNALNANMTFLNARYKNDTLANSLATLQGTYYSIKTAGISQNLTAANIILQGQLASSASVYRQTSAVYLPIYEAAVNATAHIILRELDYKAGSYPSYISNLAARQAEFNLEFQQQLNQTQLDYIATQATSVDKQIESVSSPFSLGYEIKKFEGGFISAMLAGSTAPIASKFALAPIYPTILAFIFGIIVLFIIYMLTYFRLSQKHKINPNPRVKRAWAFVFSFLFILVLIFTLLTYVYASGATSFLPGSAFINAVKASNTVIIAINSNTTSSLGSVQQCAQALQQTLQSYGKTTYLIYVSIPPYTCTYPTNSSLTGTACFNKILSQNIPTIVLNQSNSSSIIYKGLYGTIAYASGNAASGQQCLVNVLAKSVA